MKLFIKDTYVHLLKPGQAVPALPYHWVAEPGSLLHREQLAGTVLLKDGGIAQMAELLNLLGGTKADALKHLVFVPQDYEAVKAFVKNQFKVVKAAGGLVTKGDKVLLIYRLGKWDLPKGKLERDEKTADAAQREVEEECSIRVALGEKLCSTWHTYLLQGSRNIKKTTWYHMDCLDDSTMKPQVEEAITDIAWCTLAEAESRLADSYSSIRQVFKTFQDLQKVTL